MPFDSLQLSPSVTLGETLNELGITPIPEETLNTYKQRELDRHPGSFWYRYGVLLVVGMALSILTALGTGIIALMTSFALMRQSPGAACLCWVLALPSVLVLLVLNRSQLLSQEGRRFYGPAYWLESSVSVMGYRLVYSHGVPDQIDQLVSRITARLPHTQILIGELRQDSVVIDPYLIVVCDNERAVLGIWDDNGVIQHA